MDFINNLVAQFYAIPAVAEIVNSHAILRIATKQYGAPLLGLIILFVVLMLVLVLSRLGKKSNKPKPVREKKQKPKKAPRQKAAKPAKTKGPNKAILAKLAKLPKSTLPLYPVADKRKSLDDALSIHADAPLAAPQAVVDEASLVEGLDVAAEAPIVAEAAYDIAPEVEVQSFSLNEETAAQIMNTQAPEPGPDMSDDFAMPPAPLDDGPEFSDEPPLTAQDDDDDLPPLTVDPVEMEDDRDGTEGQSIDPVPSLDFDPIEPLPEEEKPEDDGESIDIPVGSFGGGDDGDLSGPAQEKLAELNDRGVT